MVETSINIRKKFIIKIKIKNFNYKSILKKNLTKKASLLWLSDEWILGLKNKRLPAGLIKIKIII